MARQRTWVAQHGGGVVEGRDIGSVVFPDAAVKVFLTASEDERARRRQRDELAAARSVDVDAVKQAIARRDSIDSSRAVSPLRRRRTRCRSTRRAGRSTTSSPRSSTGSGGRWRLRARRVSHDRSGAERGSESGVVRLLRARAHHRSVPGVVRRARHRQGERPGRRRLHRRALAPVDSSTSRSRRSITPRRIRFMAKRVAVQDEVRGNRCSPRSARSASSGGRRTAARSARSQAALDEGEPLAIFPEGTRREGPELGELYDGAAYLALKLGVPIVPVGIGGSEQILASGQKLSRGCTGCGSWSASRFGRPPRRAPRSVRRSPRSPSELRVALQQCFDEACAQAGV